jgi:hypothetical protein
MKTLALTSLIATLAMHGMIDATPAFAHPTNWSMAGAACVPTGQTASSVGTFNSAGDVGFPAGRTGEIIVTCPVHSSIVSATGLSVTYRDTDGQANGVRVSAALRQKNLANGSVSNVLNNSFDSNSFPAAPNYARNGILIGNPCNNVTFNFDHARFTYYVQVNIRKTTRAQVLLASVELTNNLIC